MNDNEKLKLLKSSRLLERVPKDKLAALGEFLQPVSLNEGDLVFEEGSAGDSLYFISSGRVRIEKKLADSGEKPALKTLAVLQAGDCFGEMALFEEKATRSARATAAEPSVVLALERKQLLLWLESNPRLAIGFFTELVQVLSKRLRRSSSEQTLLFDLSQNLLESAGSGKDLLQRALGLLFPYLDGAWGAAAFLYNPFNDEIELAATEGDIADASRAAAPKDGETVWRGDDTLLISLSGKERPLGYLAFRAVSTLNNDEKAEIGRTLTTAARLVAACLENTNFRMEEALRERLAGTRNYGSRL